MEINRTLIKNLVECDQTLHNWARILGQIGYKLVTPESDNSHANFEWNSKTNRLEGRTFGNKKNPFYIAYNIEEDSFVLLSSQEHISISVEKKSFEEVIADLIKVLDGNGFKNVELKEGLDFRFPQRFNENGMALPFGKDALQLWKTLHTGANEVLKKNLSVLNQSSEIRIWPTNFDTGIFCDYGNGLHQFAGFAPADNEVIGEPYFYNSFYQNNQRVYPLNFPKMEYGYWETEKWAGAILPISHFATSNDFIATAESFLIKSSTIFLNQRI